MALPDRLPARIYLLALDREKHRLVASDRIGYALRGAALAELLLSGAIADDGGRVTPVRTVAADGLTAAVQQEIRDAKRPRTWRHWVTTRARRARPVVRDALADGRFITVRRDRVLGLFPVDRIDVRDVLEYRRYSTGIRQLARGATPVSRVDGPDAAAIALAAVAEVKTVLDRRERRQYADRIAALGADIAPVVKAIRQAIRSDRAAAVSAATSAGSTSGG